jgi:hypothetical protein
LVWNTEYEFYYKAKKSGYFDLLCKDTETGKFCSVSTDDRTLFSTPEAALKWQKYNAGDLINLPITVDYNYWLYYSENGTDISAVLEIDISEYINNLYDNVTTADYDVSFTYSTEPQGGDVELTMNCEAVGGIFLNKVRYYEWNKKKEIYVYKGYLHSFAPDTVSETVKHTFSKNGKYKIVLEGSGSYFSEVELNITECDDGIIFSDDDKSSPGGPGGAAIGNYVLDGGNFGYRIYFAKSQLSQDGIGVAITDEGLNVPGVESGKLTRLDKLHEYLGDGDKNFALYHLWGNYAQKEQRAYLANGTEMFVSNANTNYTPGYWKQGSLVQAGVIDYVKCYHYNTKVLTDDGSEYVWLTNANNTPFGYETVNESSQRYFANNRGTGTSSETSSLLETEHNIGTWGYGSLWYRNYIDSDTVEGLFTTKDGTEITDADKKYLTFWPEVEMLASNHVDAYGRANSWLLGLGSNADGDGRNDPDPYAGYYVMGELAREATPSALYSIRLMDAAAKNIAADKDLSGKFSSSTIANQTVGTVTGGKKDLPVVYAGGDINAKIEQNYTVVLNGFVLDLDEKRNPKSGGEYNLKTAWNNDTVFNTAKDFEQW